MTVGPLSSTRGVEYSMPRVAAGQVALGDAQCWGLAVMWDMEEVVVGGNFTRTSDAHQTLCCVDAPVPPCRSCGSCGKLTSWVSVC